MTWSQSFVVLWVQFAVAAFAILLATRGALAWVKQPVERIRLIQYCALAMLILPLLMLLAPWPVARLGVISPTIVSASESRVDEHFSRPQPVQSVMREMPQPGDDNSALSQAELATGDAIIAHSTPPAIVIPPETAQHANARFTAVWASGWTWAAIGIGLFHGIAALFFLSEWLIGAIRLRRLVCSAAVAPRNVRIVWQSITQDRSRFVRLLVAPKVDAPLTFGWLRPVVLIPNQLVMAGGETLRYCLAHEWCHIQRSDFLSWQALRACRFVLWYQPLFWTLERELRVCQDMIADSQSTADRAAAVAYSELLVGFARNRQLPVACGALSMFDQPSQLMRRVTMLLARPIPLRCQCSWKFSLAAGALAAIACVLLSGVRLDAARADDKEQPQQKAERPSPAPATPTAKESTASSERSPEKAEQPAVEKSREPIPPEEQPAHLTYHCTVRDKETGAGIPNAKVTVDRLDSSVDAWPYKSVAKTTHITDAEGQFTVEIPPEQSANRFLYIQIYVEHENYVRIPGIGYGLSMIRKNETTGERPFFEDLQLQAADPITAKVVSPSGEPLAGVKIFGFTSPKVRELNSIRWLDAKTAADGSFRVNAMKGGVAFFWVMPNDYSIVQKFVNQGAADLGEIRVTEGIRIRGRTLAADGKPAGGVAVNAYYQGRDEGLQTYGVLTGIRRGAISDADGNFTFDPLPPGEYRVVPEDQLIDPRAERDVHPLPGVFVGQKVTLKEGVAAPELQLQAVPHINFHAQYVDSAGKKRQGHEFHITGRLDSEFWSARARPDKDGAVTAHLPHGLQNVQVMLITNEHSALRHRKGAGQPIENHNHNVELGTLNDDVEGFEIIRYKAPVALIQAVDSEGRPVRHFKVTAKYPWGQQRYIVAGEERSDISFEQQNDGRYRTSQMLPDEEVTFTAKAVGYESASESVKFTEGETKEIVITLKAVSAAVDAINSVVDDAAQLVDKVKPSAPPKKE